MRIITTSFFLIYSVAGFTFTKADVLTYIDLYKLIAVEEMQENGIPASIKMAQAILESNAGTSDLALQANNHFGMKCGVAWEGPTYYKKDDDRDRRGRLIKSCFRVYTDPEDSFRAHSQFLLDPRKAYRYGNLFSLDRRDYKSWAWGLRKAGYATNPAYANLLIHLIEKYALYTFDYYEDSNVKFVKPSDLVVQARDLNLSKKLDRRPQSSFISKPGEPVSASAEEIKLEINQLDVLKVRQGQTVAQLAAKYNLLPEQILKFNDIPQSIDDNLKEGMYIYLENKRIWYRGSNHQHIVQDGEDLHSISQLYGIRVSTLERKNKINANMIPIPGQKIILRGRSVRGDEIPLTYEDVEIQESREVSKPVLANQWETHGLTLEKENEIASTGEESNQITVPVFDLSREVISDSEGSERMPSKSETQTYLFHNVIKGDTLYRISQRYGVSVDSIRQQNQLETDNIQIGQKLKIQK